MSCQQCSVEYKLLHKQL